jgi:hypothetical protein
MDNLIPDKPSEATHGRKPSDRGGSCEDGTGDLIVSLKDQRRFKLKLLPPQDAGDGTVPSDYSAAKVKATVHFVQTGYDHQGSYKADAVSVSMLYAMIKIANTAEGWKTLYEDDVLCCQHLIRQSNRIRTSLPK